MLLRIARAANRRLIAVRTDSATPAEGSCRGRRESRAEEDSDSGPVDLDGHRTESDQNVQ
jgi:hypothetical protein